MKKIMLALFLAVAAAAGIGVSGVPGDTAEKTLLVIGGGAKTGIYYQVALNVCNLVNEKLGSQGYTCRSQVAAGSVTNIEALRRRWLDFALIQSDHHWQAYNGEQDWKAKPYKELRSVLGVHPETVMLMTRADTGITSVADLRGKRVNVGNPGSGTRENARDVLRIYGIDRRDIFERELGPQEAARALGQGKIDAFFYTVGNPWKEGQQIADRVKVRIIPLDAPGIKKLVADNPYYVMTAIPGGIYAGVSQDVPTLAVKATLVSNDKVSEEVVYNVVKTLFDNLDNFRTKHPAFTTLQPQGMLKGLSAPLHPGAIRYYQEKGWM